jgi:hypothetical protein
MRLFQFFACRERRALLHHPRKRMHQQPGRHHRPGKHSGTRLVDKSKAPEAGSIELREGRFRVPSLHL